MGFPAGNVHPVKTPIKYEGVEDMPSNHQRDHERFDLVNKEHSFFGTGL